MREQWVTITMEVPLKSIDFSDCGDGCGFVHGLPMAKFKGFPVLEFDDAIAATAEMNRQLGEPQAASAKPAQYDRRRASDHEQYRREALDGDLVARNRRAG